MRSIDNTEDVIDSRNVIERLEELENDPGDEDTAEELAQLRKLHEEGEQTFGREWENGVGLIRDSYFMQYAQEFADDVGAIDKDAIWPVKHIDWEAAASELRQDYSQIDFNGEVYWGRG
jgi:antirestriction protein